MTAAIVLSAGLGTRLAPLTDELAKPLMPVGDRPVLAHVVTAISEAGIATIVANTHHRSGDFTQPIARLNAKVHLVHEPRILGTAGGVANAASVLGDGSVLIWNGDIIAPDLDLAAVLAADERASADTLWVVEPTARGAGTVGLDDDGRVVRLRGERFGDETTGGDFLGIQVMSDDLRRTLPREGCLVADVTLPLLRRGGRVASFLYRGDWDDIGQPSSLLRANLRWLERQQLAAWSAGGAVVEGGAALERSLVGEGAVVSGAGILRECVVFPGARVTAPASRRLFGARASLDVA
ncbi:MAG TPA: nucleotidyltransferase family protein [Polyangiaceae bacterium]|nr:nucleotidyltransferase family protein [Polyangiaceae bacterium]